MDSRLKPGARAFELNTRLLENCLRDLDEETATRRISNRTNSISFLALHLIETRHWIVSWLGGKSENPFRELLKDAKGIDDVKEFPRLEQILAAWRDSDRVLGRCFEDLSADKLAETSDPAFPIEDASVAGGIAFLAVHESHHIGQMALLRKHFGLDAMSWG